MKGPLFALALAAVAASGPLIARAQDSAGERFVHPNFGWSVTVPENWPHRHDNANLLIRSPEDLAPGFFGIYTLVITKTMTLDELVDGMEGMAARKAEEKGVKAVLISRKNLVISQNLPAIEIIKEAGTGRAGKSMRIFVLLAEQEGHVKHRAFVFDGRTSDAQSWDILRPYFNDIVKSFSPGQ